MCWYVSYNLRYWDLVEMMAERGLSMAHTTIMRWVLKLVGGSTRAPVGRSWRVDETSIKVKGKVKGRWMYLYGP